MHMQCFYVLFCFCFFVFSSVDDYRTDRGVWIGLNDVTGSGSYKWDWFSFGLH